MKSTRTQTAIAAALLLGLGSSILGGTPAFADTVPATAPPAVEATTATTPPVTAVPANTAPVESTSPVLVPSAATPPGSALPFDPAPVEGTPLVVPAPPAPVPAALTVEPVAAPPIKGAPTPISAVRSAAITQSAPSAARPGPEENGYTQCWETEINRTDAGKINPYDARTWPAYYTPIKGQPGYLPHATDGSSFLNGEGSDIWTQVPRDSRGNLLLPSGATSYDTLNPTCSPNYPSTVKVRSTVKALSEGETAHPTTRFGGNYGGLGTADSEQIYWTAKTGQEMRMQTTFTVQLANRPPVIGFDGVTVDRAASQYTDYRFDAPETYFDQNTWSKGLVSAVTSSCDNQGVIYEPGDTATITCITSGRVDEIPWSAWVTWHDAGASQQFFLGLNMNGVLTYSTRDLFYGNDWTSETDHPANSAPWFAGTTQFQFPPAPQWLPTAQDKTFRVKAAETLTVTPCGLLTGAQWAQGNLGDLQTHITNVPAGGAVKPNGNLEFTSQQVGDYGFKYFLQDPATGLRSQDATGSIQVYSDAVVVPPPVVMPPTAVTPPVVLTPIAPVAAKAPTALVPVAPVLAFTGSDPMGAILTGILFLLAGLSIGIIRRKRVVRVPIIRQGK
jgi:hypothetical protein